MPTWWNNEPTWERATAIVCAGVVAFAIVWWAWAAFPQTSWSRTKSWFSEHAQPVMLETRSITKRDGSFYLYGREVPELMGAAVDTAPLHTNRERIVCRKCGQVFNPLWVAKRRAFANHMSDGAHEIAHLDNEEWDAMHSAFVDTPPADRALIQRVHNERTTEWARERQQALTAVLPRVGAHRLHDEPAPTRQLPVVQTHRAPEVIETAEIVAETVTETPKHAKDIFGNNGADETWADVLHNMPEGEIVPSGTSTHEGPDALTADEIDDARWGAEFAASAKRIEDAGKACTAALVEVCPEWEQMFAELDARLAAEREAHERNVKVAEAAVADIESSLSLVRAG
jgi:hypothetical protein